ncbi:MAG: alpha-2-macroglobulin family protein [Bacteroidales bacterium]
MKTKLVLLISAFAIIVFAGNYISRQQFFQKDAPSKTITSGISINYEKSWKKIDSLIGKGLSQSALEEVLKVYTASKAENNAPQFVQAIMYKMKLQSTYQEDSYENNIKGLKSEITTAAFPIKPILHSVLAEMYWRYYSINRWKWSQRTETVNFKEDDMQTWDLKKLVKEVIYNYVMSLNDVDNLKKTNLGIYDNVLVKDTATRHLRPTLYDFLANRAIDFFMNDESELTKPTYKFEISSENFFKPYADFSKLSITSKDSMSLKYYAAKIFQDLLAFHSNDTDPAALIDVDIKRLKFVKTNATMDLKDSLYLQALLNLESGFLKFSSSTDITYAIANEYYSKGSTYNATKPDDPNKWMMKKALDKCEEAIKAFPNSFGATNCKYLKYLIYQKSIAMATEEGNAPGKPFRTLVTYKNAKDIRFRIINITYEQDKKFIKKNYGEDLIKLYLKQPVIKEWSVSFPDDGDYQPHSAEIKMPELPLGYYVVLASDNKDFSTKEQIVAYSHFWITNIGFINRAKEKGAMDFYVTDRETGAPLNKVIAQAYTSKYNYYTRDYEQERWKTFTTDVNGYFEVPEADDYHYFWFDFSYRSDRFVNEESFYQYKNYESDYSNSLVTYFFTDRAIYRPGQTIYFKGIMLRSDKTGKKYDIAPHQKTTVTFYDVNYQKISELELTSNDYGTFTGTFIAPANITGQVYITNGVGSQYFSVEEYKRPKFEVIIDTVKGTYKLNDIVTVKGLAKAYAGNVIDNADVKYRVVRTATFPYWFYWWWGYYPSSPEMEIINGTTTTDDKGEFSVSFKAIPDLSVSKKYTPTFTYTVYADITDINGETHSAQKYVEVGYKALNLSVNIPAQLDKEGKDYFYLYTTNLNGDKEPAAGTIKIYKLKQPDKVFRERQWTKPDKYIMSKEDYYAAFPNDLYDDENNMYKWDKGEQVFEMNFQTPKDTAIIIKNLPDWKQGAYVVEARSKDKYGEDVDYYSYFTVFGLKEKQTPDNSINYFSIVKGECEPGDSASFMLGTKDANTSFLYEIEYNGKIISKQWLKLNNEQRLIKIPIKEEYRGGIGIHLFTIKHNRYFINEQSVTIPFTNKELDLEFETFRDKLQPGQKEEWKIKIKSKKGDKVAAEMLATMYDASLDAYRPNYWNFNIYNSLYSSLYWDGYYCFTSHNSTYYSFYGDPYLYPLYRQYDRLNWFGFDYGGYYRYEYDFDGVADEVTATGSAPAGKAKMRAVNTSNAVAQVTEEKEVDKNESHYSDNKKADLLPASTPVDQTVSKTKDQGLIAGEKAGKDGRGNNSAELAGIQARSNFNETAFFYPQLQTNENGEVIISFTIPEALTKWKMMGLATTKDLKIGQIEKELVTQKDLMIVPNAPRFFREDDKLTFTAKVSNLTDKEMVGDAQLFLFDATTEKPIDELCKNAGGMKSFKASKGQSAVVNWNIEIPEGIGAIKYKVVAKSGKFTDGEEMAIPVLNNRMLVTETLPLPIRGKQTKDFTFEKLVNSKSSTTLKNYKLTLEYTSNPAWYAIQALPYMMEYPYECAEQVFARFYANSIAAHIANAHPKIKAVFDSWRTLTPNALLSNLEKNQELKSLMLEETPWVLQGQDESERKQRIALLFDLNKMSYDLDKALAKLEKMQLPNGGWPWFGGVEDDRYITQYIVTGFGHLDKLGVKSIRDDAKCWKMIKDGVLYLDDRMREDYEWLKKYGDLGLDNLGGLEIQYLYARSYFLNDIRVENRNKEAYDYYVGQAKKYWLENNRYLQGMIALALNRMGDKATPADIMKSLKENSLNSDEMGMYWRDMSEGYYWYQAPIETQALLIEAFDEVSNDTVSVNNLKIWLLKQKQTQDWKTTTATAEACYALLLRGANWLASDQLVKIKVGDMDIDPKKMDNVKVEAGTGYFKTSWSGNEITPDMGKVTVTKSDDGVSWGALYWQYFEQLDKITPAETPLKLEKKLSFALTGIWNMCI